MKEECGVAGVIIHDPAPPTNIVAFKLYYALYALQHRGQDSTGIVVFDGTKPRSIKRMGLVSEAYSRDTLQNIVGYVGVGHVRNATYGTQTIENCQPFVLNFKGGVIAISHNGNLVNSAELKDELESEGRIFTTALDAEIIGLLLVKELLRHNPVDALKSVMRRIIGSYALTIMINGDLYAVRDPIGNKPICYGEIEGGYAAVSESVALDTIKGKLIRDLRPGEIMIFKKTGELESVMTTDEDFAAHCVFEYIYLARPDSILDGTLVYSARERIGKELALEHPAVADIVSPVPDSGIAAAIGYSRESGLKYLEGLMKNRYIGRTFILPHQEMREMAVRLKMNTIGENLKDKSVVLVDDSVVRGTTSRRIIDMIKDAGAKEVHLRVASPPIIAPCYLGIDMPTRAELIASHKTIEGVCAAVNADTIGYLSADGLVKAIGIDKSKLCLGCITELYPVPIPNEKCYCDKQSKMDDFVPEEEKKVE
ncbi:Amidophosphoribosyltransferase [Methanimicrococcus hongohii]|uniref:Amidophosphoribosyltransferase n=1 Tax=Methanimicrococcus hongohii TaxID=3028295 RepID=A0AA96UZG8_9EURY|nr:amidophosphoribosyltransferase [Methanimicrococcus sp. Hf6]WNY22918.1 Amidophosphoribosyltransferase [Methanimicrococcus sp. Hf6]